MCSIGNCEDTSESVKLLMQKPQWKQRKEGKTGKEILSLCLLSTGAGQEVVISLIMQFLFLQVNSI